MKIYVFGGCFPYEAVICANNAEEAKVIYTNEVSDLDADCADELPAEVDKKSIAERMVNIPEETGFATVEEYIDNELLGGVPCVIGMDRAL